MFGSKVSPQAMSSQITLLLRLVPDPNATSARASIIDAETLRQVRPPHMSVSLTLEHESGATYARGQLEVVNTGMRYPIQTNQSLFELLRQYLRSSGRLSRTDE